MDQTHQNTYRFYQENILSNSLHLHLNFSGTNQ
nr:MAG TPA: hypothetical protein [Crassvirales sp.]